MLTPHIKEKKKRILNSSDNFLARLSWLAVLSKLASFKAKDDFKWEVVIKNLEPEAEALKELRKHPWPEPVHFPMGFLLSAGAGNLQKGPRSPTPITATQAKGVAYQLCLS